MPDEFRVLYYEDVKERCGDVVTWSKITIATPEQIQEAADLHKKGKCPHTIVWDEWGPIFTTRHCHTCGDDLGWV